MKDVAKYFLLICGVAGYFGIALNMIASNQVPPASANQCTKNPFWCYCSQHDWTGILGLLMIALGMAVAFAIMEGKLKLLK